jgi:hypothetical protein
MIVYCFDDIWQKHMKAPVETDPFRPSTSARKLAEVLAAARRADFETLRLQLVAFSGALRSEPALSAVTLMQGVETLLDPVAARAVRNLASTLDRRAAQGSSYHNLAHTMEVVGIALSLGLAESAQPSSFATTKGLRLTRENIGDLVVSALLHDLGHPGGNNGGAPLKIERESWKIAEPLLKDAGYAGQRLDTMQDIALLTDPVFGTPIADAVMICHAGAPDQKQRAIIGLAAFLEDKNNLLLDRFVHRLMTDPLLSTMASILNKSDIAFSLMPETYVAQTQRFHDEYAQHGIPIKLVDEEGVPLPKAAAYFFNVVAGVTNEGFALGCVEKLLGASARATKATATGTPLPGEEPVRESREAPGRFPVPRSGS